MAVGAGPSQWVRRFHPPTPGAPRLICFPHAGGAASVFFRLSEALGSSAEVLAIQYPGRQDRRRERGIDDIGVLADRVVAALEPWTAEPPALFGHSMGAIVAFEVARRLEQGAGIVSPRLFVSSRRAPSRQRHEDLHRRPDAELVAELHALEGTHPGLLEDEDVRLLLLPALRTDYRAIETYRYRPGPRVAAPITALHGEQDSRVTLEEVLAWGEHTSGGFECRTFPGGHFYLAARPVEVAELLAARLATGSGREPR